MPLSCIALRRRIEIARRKSDTLPQPPCRSPLEANVAYLRSSGPGALCDARPSAARARLRRAVPLPAASWQAPWQ